MQRALDQQLMTFEEAAKLDPDEQGGELDGGRWVPVTRGTWRHGKVVVKVGFFLELYARENPGWSVAGADSGTKLGHDPDILRGPDVGIVRVEREPKGRGAQGWLEGAPDVAVEVIGDSQSASDLAKKALEYLAAGAKMVWVFDPDRERVIVYSPQGLFRVLGADEILDGGDVLPGFACKVGEFFK